MLSGGSLLSSVNGMGFSRPAVIRGNAARHCFLSIPHSWLYLPVQSSMPVFVVEASKGRSLVLSWAGDTHGHDGSLNQSEQVILVSQQLLQNSNILDGDGVVVTQVSIPPPCEAISVGVSSEEDWQDLALNADSAQSEFLNQVRVVSVGESVPLWLAGGVCVKLNVLRISPPLNVARLDPMSEVEILPPSESQEYKDSLPISFNPSLLTGSSLSENISEQENSENSDKKYSHEDNISNGNRDDSMNSEKMLLKIIINFINENNSKRCLKNSLFFRKELFCSFRVVPMPFTHNSELSSIFDCHPSLIVISKSSIYHSHYRDSIRLFGNMKLVESSNDVQNNAKIQKEDQFEGEKVKTKLNDNSKKESSYKVVALIWENFLKNRKFEDEFVAEMNNLVVGHNCVVSTGLRRMCKLEATKIVGLKTCPEDSLKNIPVSIDITPLFSYKKEQKKKFADIAKKTIIDILSICDIIVNSQSLLKIQIDGTNSDILLGTRDNLPLLLSLESAALLNISVVSQNPESLPSITRASEDLDNYFISHFSYLGDEEILNSLCRNIINGLGVCDGHIKSIPQFIIVQGSKGSGKSSLVETAAQYLSHSPHFIYCDMIQFKQLRGKKVDTIEKKLQNVLKMAIHRRPSLIILEDLDQIVGAPGPTDQDFGPVYEHTMQMASAFKKILGQIMTVNQDGYSYFQSENPKMGQVVVVATCAERTQIHPLLTSPQGCHYFPITISLPVLTASNRYYALCQLLCGFITKVFNEEHQPKYISLSKAEIENLYVSETKDIFYNINLSEKIVKRDTEGFILSDLSHLAVRTFLEAKKRWKSREKNDVKEDITESPKKPCGNDATLPKLDVSIEDFKAALQGYTPLTLRDIHDKELIGKKIIRDIRSHNDVLLTSYEIFVSPKVFGGQRPPRIICGLSWHGCGEVVASSITGTSSLSILLISIIWLSQFIAASILMFDSSFERAQSAAPCILFFDEFESLAPRRGHDSTGVTDRVVNQLLTQMDGVEGLSGVYILAATSRPDLIDPALLRPGRLDKCVFCPMPSKEDRYEILCVLSENMELGEVINWESIADVTDQFSGADLQSLLSTAQIIVAQEAIGDELYGGITDTGLISNHFEQVKKEDFQDELLNDGVKSELSIKVKNVNISSEINKDFDINDRNTGRYESEKVTGAIKKQKQVYIEKGRDLVYFDNTFERKDYTSNENVEENRTNIKPNFSYHNDETVVQKGVQVIDNVYRNDQKSKRIKVFKRHIEMALAKVKPSVSESDRKKYTKLYKNFIGTKEGNFGNEPTGKRSTLA
ncbi:unnamed protein product, partial [Meganyctiphanes norvegica]